MLIATHEMGFARDIASRVCFLDAGRILEEGPPDQFTIADIQEAEAALNRNEVLPYLILVNKLNKISVYGALVGEITRGRYEFQSARYDGDLQGTEVGMVLFYTDLLAKLWAIDYLGKAPTNFNEDFRSMTKIPLSPVYLEESRKLPSTETLVWNKG